MPIIASRIFAPINPHCRPRTTLSAALLKRLLSTRRQPIARPLKRSQIARRKDQTLQELRIRPNNISELNNTDDADHGEEPVINWFEQLSAGSAPRRVAAPEDTIFKEETELLRVLKQEMADADRDLHQMNKDAPLRMLEPYTKHLDPEQKQRLQETMEAKNAQKTQRVHALKQMIPRLQVHCALPIEKKPYLQRFNKNIELSLLHFNDPPTQKKLWKSFIRLRGFLPDSLHHLSTPTWNLLHRTQVMAAARGDSRWATRIISLVNEMRRFGQGLRPDQSIQLIEAFRAENRYREAAAQCNELQQLCKDDKGLLKELDLLRVHICTSQGDLKTAEQLALRYLSSGYASEARILIPIIDACVKEGDEQSIKHAWELYVHFQIVIRSEIAPEDFDTISFSFLSVGRVDLALSVFKDMMLCGMESKESSVSIYQGLTLPNNPGDDILSTVLDAGGIPLTTLSAFPSAMLNKFFFGKWLKRLLNQDQADAAAAVVGFMTSKGVKPDAKCVNGIIGAWLRSTNDSNQARAEQMAWALINRRLARVKRSHRSSLYASVNKVNLGQRSTTSPSYLERRMPSATVETFALLLQLYIRRRDYSGLGALQGAFEQGRIAASSYWLNPLLSLNTTAQMHHKVWERYLNFFDNIKKPDIATFACLWASEQQHLEMPTAHRRLCKFPKGRRILTEMVSWLRGCSRNELQAARGEFNRTMYESIIKCLIRDQDVPAAVIALLILREYFGCYPGQATTVTAVKEITALTSPPVHVARKCASRRLKSDVFRRARDSQAGRIFHELQEERVQDFKDLALGDIDDVSDEFRRNERLVFLDQYLKRVLQHLEGQAESERLFSDAAIEIGVQTSLHDHLRQSPFVGE